jgi:DNA polymerase-3 subunit delta'
MQVQAVKQALQDHWDVEEEQAELLAHLCGGRLGWAVRAATDPEVLPRRAKLLEDLFSLAKASLVERFSYADGMVRDLVTPERKLDLVAVEEVLDTWASWWRDVMLVAAGASGSLTNLDMEDQLRSQAKSLGPSRAADLVKAVGNAMDRLRRNANPRLSLEVLIGFDLPKM